MGFSDAVTVYENIATCPFYTCRFVSVYSYLSIYWLGYGRDHCLY